MSADFQPRYQDNAMEETKVCEQIVLRKSDIHMGKEKNKTLILTSHTTKKINFRRVIDVNVKAKTVTQKKT